MRALVGGGAWAWWIRHLGGRLEQRTKRQFPEIRHCSTLLSEAFGMVWMGDESSIPTQLPGLLVLLLHNLLGRFLVGGMESEWLAWSS